MSFWNNLSKAAAVFSTGVVHQAESFAKSSAHDASGMDSEAEEPEHLAWDPFSIIESLGYKDKPSAITYGTLSTMVWRTPLLQNIILTRLNQLAQFTVRPPDKFSTGYKVCLDDESEKMSAADKKRATQLESMVQNTGVIKDNILERCSLETFARAVGRDSLTYDQGCWETTYNRKGQPAAFYAVDASTIRLADTSSLGHSYDPDRIHTVQIYDNMVINQWTKSRMAFWVRNPHTSIRLYGYGVSEAEMLVNAITAILWAWEYNQRFFSQGSVAKGILNIKGTMNQRQLRAFRRHWYQMISGVENAWRSPVLNSAEGAEWVDMHPSNRDMEFSAWMDFLIKMIASCYQMDPLEVGFKYGDSGQQKSMFESGNKEKLTASKDKGLKPFVNSFFTELTRNVVAQAEPGFKIIPVGLERETKEELAKINQLKVKVTHTVNELREEEGKDPLPEGDIILDPVYVQHLNNLEQQKLQKDQMSMQQDQQLMDAVSADSGDGEPEEDPDEFSEDDFHAMADKSTGTAGPAGKPSFSKSMKPRKPKKAILELEI